MKPNGKEVPCHEETAQVHSILVSLENVDDDDGQHEDGEDDKDDLKDISAKVVEDHCRERCEYEGCDDVEPPSPLVDSHSLP